MDEVSEPTSRRIELQRAFLEIDDLTSSLLLIRSTVERRLEQVCRALDDADEVDGFEHRLTEVRRRLEHVLGAPVASMDGGQRLVDVHVPEQRRS